MHRSGTSALARGLQMLGVYLGNDFLSPKPDNPTGYWEDRNIYELNERLLAVFGLKWEDVALIDDARWDEPEVEALRAEAVEYLRSQFVSHPLWGFKDPRTIRLLPFWHSVLHRLEVDECYLVVIRNPRSVAASLIQRHGMDAVTAHLLWLVYVVPNLSKIANRPFIVTDYDLVMADPRRQLERIARGLKIPLNDTSRAGIEQFASDFLDPNLRHSFFNESDFETDPNLPPLTREAYLWLRPLATDRTETDSPRFWSAWESSRKAVERTNRRRQFRVTVGSAQARAIKRGTPKPEFEQSELRCPAILAAAQVRVLADSDTSLREDGAHLFVVIGAQRTGTNILREILNTNEQIAMLGEVLSPSPAPAHWDNFCRGLPVRSVLPASFGETESLLDQYFEFVRYRIRNHWEGNKKSRSHAFGVDIKYNQLETYRASQLGFHFVSIHSLLSAISRSYTDSYDKKCNTLRHIDADRRTIEMSGTTMMAP